jgi:hypothetical protein
MALEDSLIQATSGQRIPHLFAKDMLFRLIENIEEKGIDEGDDPSVVNDQDPLEGIVEHRSQKLYIIPTRTMLCDAA